MTTVRKTPPKSSFKMTLISWRLSLLISTLYAKKCSGTNDRGGSSTEWTLMNHWGTKLNSMPLWASMLGIPLRRSSSTRRWWLKTQIVTTRNFKKYTKRKTLWTSFWSTTLEKIQSSGVWPMIPTTVTGCCQYTGNNHHRASRYAKGCSIAK